MYLTLYIFMCLVVAISILNPSRILELEVVYLFRSSLFIGVVI